MKLTADISIKEKHIGELQPGDKFSIPRLGAGCKYLGKLDGKYIFQDASCSLRFSTDPSLGVGFTHTAGDMKKGDVFILKQTGTRRMMVNDEEYVRLGSNPTVWRVGESLSCGLNPSDPVTLLGNFNWSDDS